MKLREIYKKTQTKENIALSNKRPVISFEVFPPKVGNIDEKIKLLFDELKILKKFSPSLISVTYGAGGTTAENAIEITRKLISELSLTPMPHFTCILKNKKIVLEYLELIQKMGIENILALRGDIPEGMKNTGGEFRWANELVEFIKARTDLSIGVAGYPEGHIESKTLADDIKNLKRKVAAGADVIYTQLFFDNNIFFKYLEETKKADIKIPIIPGILPVSSYSQLEKMVKLCRVTIPDKFREQLEKYQDSPDDIKKIGIEFASKQCAELIKSGVPGLHFYCLNKSQPAASILENIL